MWLEPEVTTWSSTTSPQCRVSHRRSHLRWRHRLCHLALGHDLDLQHRQAQGSSRLGLADPRVLLLDHYAHRLTAAAFQAHHERRLTTPLFVPLFTDPPVDRLAEEIGVAGMTGGLLNEVQQDPSEREVPAVSQRLARHLLRSSSRSDDVLTPLARFAIAIP